MAIGATTGEPEPSETLRVFGSVVKAFRKRAGLTQEQLAEGLGYSVDMISSIEQGRRMPQPEFVDATERELDAVGMLSVMLPHVVRRPGLASRFRQWALLETEAMSLYTYECRIVPGLLQTESYARAVVLNVPPLPSSEELNQRLAARLERQELLSTDRNPPCAFSFIIEEAVFTRRTGGNEVTCGLVDHILRVVRENWNVEVQVMPLHQPTHAGLDGSMQLLETPDNIWRAYSEGQKTGVLISDPKAISVLQQRYAKLRSQALTPADSVRLLEQLRGAL
ncbi:Helix-turn-helix domain-containing protein [Streptomyces sp. TverLS-915]|uniref:helix-turn-helix domain-containing protein n=1 Tax=unclassified Streptomyces TaxID=2593676 RepID=UPI0001B55F20|nr:MULTISPECIES: helix-turn-helix transcriptional regulator [unclassified Streptomyces]EFL03287.1 DNA-binding protein [Streptomyces sp. SPB78]SCE10095.1 Helix-turn-helix domain-containing protein [Streptomyces sp. TverLS-915]